jgi:hypothetical protein
VCYCRVLVHWILASSVVLRSAAIAEIDQSARGVESDGKLRPLPVDGVVRAVRIKVPETLVCRHFSSRSCMALWHSVRLYCLRSVLVTMIISSTISAVVHFPAVTHSPGRRVNVVSRRGFTGCGSGAAGGPRGLLRLPANLSVHESRDRGHLLYAEARAVVARATSCVAS